MRALRHSAEQLDVRMRVMLLEERAPLAQRRVLLLQVAEQFHADQLVPAPGLRVDGADEFQEFPRLFRMFGAARNGEHVGIGHREVREFRFHRRPGRAAVFHAGRELADVVAHPDALEDHRDLGGEERVLGRREIAEPARERLDLFQAVLLRVFPHPLVTFQIARRRADGDLPAVPEPAAEPLRERPRKPARLLRQKTELRDVARLRVALRQLLRHVVQFRQRARRVFRVEPGGAEHGLVPVEHRHGGRARHRPRHAAVDAHVPIDRIILFSPLLRRRPFAADEIVQRPQRVQVRERVGIGQPDARHVRRVAARGGDERFAGEIGDAEILDDDLVLPAVELVHHLLHRLALGAGPLLPVRDVDLAVGRAAATAEQQTKQCGRDAAHGLCDSGISPDERGRQPPATCMAMRAHSKRRCGS